MNRKSTQTTAMAATVICHIIWGFSFMFSRMALESASVFQLLSHRFVLAFLGMNLLLLTGKIRMDLRKKGIGPLLLLGLMQPVLYFIGEQYGILHSSTIFSGVMIANIPIVATLASWPILKEKTTGRQLLFSLISVGGVIGIGLLSGSGGALDLIGLAALLLAVASAAAYLMLSRGISDRYSPFERTYVMMALSSLVFTAFSFLESGFDLSAYIKPFSGTTYLISILYLSLLSSVIAFFLSGYALTHLTVARESVFSNLTTVVSVFAGAVFLHEPFTWLSLIFCLLILLGIWGVQRAAQKPDQQMPPGGKSS